MKLSKFAFLILTGLFLTFSCVSQDDIKNLQNQIDTIKDSEISSINKQLKSITTSLTDLEKADAGLKTYIDNLTETSKKLDKAIKDNDTKLEAAKTEFNKAIADAKKEAADDNTTLKNDLVKSIEAAKSDVIAQLSAARTELQNQVDNINDAITALKAKDIELEGKIADLRTYADNQTTDVKDWASATFVTLEQYNSTASTIASIQQTIEGLNQQMTDIDDKIKTSVTTEIETALEPIKSNIASDVTAAVSEGYTTAIANAKSEIEAAYTQAIADAVSAMETSLKSWVNEKLTGYYTTAQTDAKLSVLKTNLESQLASQKSYLENLISSLQTQLEGKISANTTLIKALRSDVTTLQGNVSKNANAIADNSTKIADNAKAIVKNASAISANSTKISKLESNIASLESEMNSKITALQNKVTANKDDITKINSEITAVKSDYASKISALRTEMTKLISANTDLIKANKTAIETNAEGVKSNKTAIADLKTSTDAAISENASKIAANAKDIADNGELIANNASAINNNASAIADNAADIAKLRSDLETAKTDLTAAYKAAIKEAIETSEGKITAQIAEEVNTINAKIASEVAAVNSTIEALTKRVATCEKDIKSIKSQIYAIQNDIEDIQEQITAILARIHSIAYVPQYSDGKAVMTFTNNGTITPGTATFDFELKPASTAAEVAAVWQTALSMSAVYTITKASPETVALTVESVSAENGFLSVTVSGRNLKDAYFLSKCSANVRLGIFDGNNDLITGYIPMVPVEVIDFEDAIFKSYCVDRFDANGDGEISILEAENITNVNCSGKGVSSLAGLEACANLETLDCSNNSISTIRLPRLTKLETLRCFGNPISELDLTGCITFRHCYMKDANTDAIQARKSVPTKEFSLLDYTSSANSFKLSFAGIPHITLIKISKTNYVSIDISDNDYVTDVDIANNANLTSVDLCHSIVVMLLAGNQKLENVDVSALTLIEDLHVHMNNLHSLDVSKNVNLKTLYCFDNDLSTLDVQNNTALENLNVSGNKLTLLNLTKNTMLKDIDVSGNDLVGINVRNCLLLETLNVSGNANISVLNVDKNPELTTLNASGLGISELDLTKNEKVMLLNISDSQNLKSIRYKLLENIQNRGIIGWEPTLTELRYSDTMVYGTIAGLWWYPNNVGYSVSNTYGEQYTSYQAKTTCPSGWRVPTRDEQSSLSAHYSDFTTCNGMNGRWFSGSNTYSESVPSIFLPAAGNDGSNRGSYGCYWSSAIINGYDGYSLCFDSFNVSMNINNRSNSYSVRCVKD